ncbi:MAG: DUF423 domain-containing protein [Deltaproteobacteria bacterium]|nr:DUF423 domain-containing protein [Deltaproteobacteria bacterium]
MSETSLRSTLIALGALNAALSVAAGAFGAHGLRDRLEPRALEIFETAARYHMYHALAMVLAGLLAARGGSLAPGARTAGWMFQVGIVVFSGSLYALALTDIKVLGAITPLGGAAFLAGWLWLAYRAWGARRG